MMQYILTEEEYGELISKKDYDVLLKDISNLKQYILTHTGFTCRHKEKYSGYCDKCPIGGVTQKKNSLTLPELSYQLSSMICTESKRYSI